MQPYAGTTANVQSSSRPAERVVSAPAGLLDVVNILIVLNLFALVLILIPPQHEYPVKDDWIYIASARQTLDSGVFIMPDWSQANLIGLVEWGVLWARLFGFSVSVLTYSVLFLSVCGLIAFYGILRELRVGRRGSLLGTLMLGFNPIYLHLSYTFMTDVPFLALELIACYFFIKGIKAEWDVSATAWLVTGSLFAGWAFMIRQFGVLVPAAFLGYLVLNSISARRLEWKKMLPIMGVFGAVLVGWYAWAHNLPTTWALASASSRAENFLFKPWWPNVVIVRWLTYIPFAATFCITAVRMRRNRSWIIFPLVLAAMVAGMFLIKQAPIEAAQLEPPFTMRIGSLAIDLPQDEYTFGLWGSVVRPVGLDFDEFSYTQQPVWSPEAWHLLWGVSVVFAALLVTSAIDRIVLPRWRKGQRETLPPALAFYLVGTGVFLITTAYVGDLFLRYALGLMPFFIFFVVSRSQVWGRIAWPIASAALAVLVAFTLCALADNVEHNNTRWEAGRWMEQRTGAVRVGWNWDHSGHVDSETYAVSDVPIDGFRIERAFPYTSRLSGFTTRYVLAQSRIDMPPLPETALYP